MCVGSGPHGKVLQVREQVPWHGMAARHWFSSSPAAVPAGSARGVFLG